MKRRVFNVVACIMALVLVVGLYRAKSEADSARRRVEDLEAEIARLRTETRVLAAEEAMLDNPARVERLADRYLGLKPPAPELAPVPPAAPETPGQ